MTCMCNFLEGHEPFCSSYRIPAERFDRHHLLNVLDIRRIRILALDKRLAQLEKVCRDIVEYRPSHRGLEGQAFAAAHALHLAANALGHTTSCDYVISNGECDCKEPEPDDFFDPFNPLGVG